MSELNPEQQIAAKFRDGVFAIIAVPGSGKTKTMMERIGILVNEYKYLRRISWDLPLRETQLMK